MRVVVPPAPKLLITALDDMEVAAWFDVLHKDMKGKDFAEEDAAGMAEVCVCGGDAHRR